MVAISLVASREVRPTDFPVGLVDSEVVARLEESSVGKGPPRGRASRYRGRLDVLSQGFEDRQHLVELLECIALNGFELSRERATAFRRSRKAS